ncbi:MerR family transcriptional regulator [Sphingobacteriales bacterium UPWRP_1]|nr:hypothetical protein B6N25_15230 [Sphingobacteriales bacterium TSM_CSS]PSJ78776.1 MerR family transcriptional regulator [Sphingobacteriales bacterium UPWRP_1]
MEEKDKGTKRYYTIGEVAQMLQVNASLLRYWETEFSILKPGKNRKGNRQFTEQDIDNLRLIYHLVKKSGYTLEGAKKRIKEMKAENGKQAELTRSLQHIKNALQNLLTALDELPDTSENHV